MSLTYNFGRQDHKEEATKEVTFNVEPLMCMDKCARAIAFALGKLNIPQQNLAFDIPNKRVTVKMLESMENQQVIETLVAHGRKASLYIPAKMGMGYGAGK
jgi:hypothetical protein